MSSAKSLDSEAKPKLVAAKSTIDAFLRDFNASCDPGPAVFDGRAYFTAFMEKFERLIEAFCSFRMAARRYHLDK